MYRILLTLGFCAALACAQQATITTIAGAGQFHFAPGSSASSTPLGTIGGVATDPQGNVYATDASNGVVVKIATTGVLTIVAGNGVAPFQNNIQPFGYILADASGNLFVGDGCSVRKIDSTGIVSAFAGSGICTYFGDGGPAAQAAIGGGGMGGMALDANGNLYIADYMNDRVRKVTPQGIISTVAGNGRCCFTGDGVQATSTSLSGPSAVAVDSNGILYIADTFNERIRRVGADGIITTIAGGNGVGFDGDGGPATAAMFNWPTGLAFESSGALDIADMNNNRVRRITPDGIIHTIAGTGTANFTGDQGPGSLATLIKPNGVAVDSSGNVYVSDSGNFRVRKIDPAGIITTFAGNGNAGFSGEGGQARTALLNAPWQTLIAPSGDIYISDTANNRVRKIAPNGVITTVAGTAATGFGGDDGPATQALLNRPIGMALDSAGNLYIADTGNKRVRKVDVSGNITTFAGNGAIVSGTTPSNGDGGPAVNASLQGVVDLAFDANGNLYIAQATDFGSGPNAIRRVSPDGTISTFTSSTGVPVALAFDATGNLYVSVVPGESLGGPPVYGGVVRISPDGATITTVFTFPPFTSPGKGAFDSQGNFYVPDNFSSVYRISPSGAQTVVAGTTQQGFSGDEGPATLAQLNKPTGVAIDPAGNLYIADSGNNRIRKVFLNPASGIFQPTLQTTLQPGYYTATVTLGQGEHPGYWGMQVLAPVGVLAGGFNLGGGIQQRSLPPGFGGIYVPSPQSVHLHVDAQTAGGGSGTVALGVQIVDASNNPVNTEQFGGTSLDFTQPLSTGYYTIVIRGGANSQVENFQMAVGATQLSGGVVIGGFANPNSTGFGGFDLTAPQQVTIQVFGQPTYGADAAGGLRLTLYDSKSNVIATVP